MDLRPVSYTHLGSVDAQTAILAAERIGIPSGTTIYLSLIHIQMCIRDSFSAYAASPPAVGDTELSAVTIVWNYVGELVFNLLVLVGAIKASDRIVREMMGLGG